jgi:LmbE family N-acetylglucosaminyl deacetylase
MRNVQGPLTLVLVASAVALTAQVRPIYSRGAPGLVQQLERLQSTKSALHTGAHPDDEDSALVAALARGEHARTAYLSLTRGEGGQNILGSEFYEALGVLRTEELLQARRLDGAEQLFTRAVDFGFTTSMDEASKKWGDDIVLGDMVLAIRRFRPLVVISRFSGTPADGHGHHQLAGAFTPKAFAAAADARAFPEHAAAGIRPWQARKLYVEEGFSPAAKVEPTMHVETGVWDPVLGRSHFEIAMEARSQHKSQEMGRVESRGPHRSGLKLVAEAPPSSSRSHAPSRGERSVFDGIDTSIRGIASLAELPAGTLAADLQAIEAAARRALGTLDIRNPARILPTLAEGLRRIRTARQNLARLAVPEAARDDALFLLAQKAHEFERAMLLASGVVVDALGERETVVAGESVGVTVNVFVPEGSPVKIGERRLAAPKAWTVSDAPAAPADPSLPPFLRRLGDAPTASTRYRVDVPSSAEPTTPYWLDAPLKGWTLAWQPDDPPGDPFALEPLAGEVVLTIAGVELTTREPVQFRQADPVRGEIRRRVDVVPALTLEVEPSLDVLRLNDRGKGRPITVTVTSHATAPRSGLVRLAPPAGWKVDPVESPFTLERGHRQALQFTVLAPADAQAGLHTTRAEAVTQGVSYAKRMQAIAYPHIATHRLYAPAEAALRLIDLRVAPVKVGYIMGTGDDVPAAIGRMGVTVTLLTPEDLARGDLSAFDTIVVGIRASEARPDFVANHGRLMDWVRAGGALIVQFQMADYARKGLPPYPAEIGSRVTDEDAPVTVLAPDHPVFTFPNRIGPEDWNGWVQERNAYGFSTFDPRYVPLLESHDPWDTPQRGGQIYARIGKGHYVYTAYSWFRELPPGVSGAYRLMANLVSLPKAAQP